MNLENILPPNSSEELIAVEQTLANRIKKLDESDFNLNPLTCKAEFLPHLAYMYSLDISSLDEDEKRALIQNAFEIRRYQGSKYSTRKALEIVFSEAKLVEWFEDKNLEPFHFRADLTLKSDVNKKYDEKKFLKFFKLLDSAKNEKSVFAGFEIKMPTSESKLNLIGGGVMNVELNKGVVLNISTSQMKIIGAAVWTI